MNKQNSLSSISKYRSPIMGMAIIWVVMFHYRLQAPILSVISNYGYAGVDFFMFLSAFGLYYSMSKNDNVMMFYKKDFCAYFPRISSSVFYVPTFYIKRMSASPNSCGYIRLWVILRMVSLADGLFRP